MNDIDKIPVKCRNCPYWELASFPWCCGDCTEKMNPKNSEYIKRIDAKRALTALPADLDAETVQRCIEAMNNPKAADVEPLRHGRWSRYGEGAICSVCQKWIDSDISRDMEGDVTWPHYCPSCGAKMDKEVDNGNK